MRTLAATTFLVFLFVILFGLNLSMRMDKGMSLCPLMNSNSSFCQMPATDHFAGWQQMFAAILQFSYFGAMLAVIFVGFKFLLSELILAPPSLRRYKTDYPENRLFNKIVLAFSDGILHSKIP